MSFAEQAAEKFLRTALRKVRKTSARLTQGGCGAYKACRTKAKDGLTGGCCALCALLRYELVDREAPEPLEAAAADLLGVEYDWIMSFLQGWDGDESCANGYALAYRLGKKLWLEFQPTVDEVTDAP